MIKYVTFLEKFGECFCLFYVLKDKTNENMSTELQKTISELDEYIALCKSRLESILSVLGWNEEDTLKENPCLREKPKEQKEDKDDPLLPGSFGCKYSIVIGEDQLNSILKTNNASIPKRFSDIQSNFTREQKREIYDYVIYNTGKVSEPELKVSQSGNDMTFAEIVAKAKKKDKKLQRKYRTSKPTHIEEVRNLVYLQMQALAQYFNPNASKLEKINQPVQKDERRKHERGRRSRSRERGMSSYHYRKSRSRSRHRKDRSRDKSNRQAHIQSTSELRDERFTARKSKSPRIRRSESSKRGKCVKSSKKKSKKRSRSRSKKHAKSKKSKRKRDGSEKRKIKQI